MGAIDLDELRRQRLKLAIQMAEDATVKGNLLTAEHQRDYVRG